MSRKKHKRKTKEYYFETYLQCGVDVEDYFSDVMELHDYFITLQKGQTLWIRGHALKRHCRFSMGVYTPDMTPIDVQVCMPDAVILLKKVSISGEYVVRLRCETAIAGDYQLQVACEKGILSRAILQLSYQFRRYIRMPF